MSFFHGTVAIHHFVGVGGRGLTLTTERTFLFQQADASPFFQREAEHLSGRPIAIPS
jgi:hypothetical protein